MPSRTTPSRNLVFLGACALIAAWLAADLTARRTMLAGELKYIPPQHVALVAFGRPDRLWNAIDDEVGEIIRADPFKGPLFQAMRRFQAKLKTQDGQLVQTAEDLEKLGFDGSRGVLSALYSSTHSVAVMHATDVPRLLATLARYSGGEVEAPANDRPGIYRAGDFFVANPEGRVLVVSDDDTLVQTAIAGSPTARAHALAADALYEPIARDLRIPMLTGASVFASFTVRSIPTLRRGSVVIRLDHGISIDVIADLNPSPYRVFDAFVSPPPPLQPWSEALASTALGALMFRDEATRQYLDALARIKGMTTIMQERYAGVLWELRDLASLRQLAIAVTGFRGGLPDLALGTWAQPDAIDAMITRIQTRARVTRDQAILRSALARGEQPVEEPGGLFPRYPVRNGDVGPAELSAKDFENPSYRRQMGGATVRFLLPPITGNDLKYRAELEPLADQPELTSDRYRIAVARLGNATWFATDAAALEEQLRKTDGTASLETTPLFALARRSWTAADRLQAFVNVDQVLDAALLNPEAHVDEKFIRAWRDLRGHPAISMTLTSSDDPPRARVKIRLERRP